MSTNEIGIEQARKTLGDLADAAHHHGQTTILTRHGRALAAITPFPLITHLAKGGMPEENWRALPAAAQPAAARTLMLRWQAIETIARDTARKYHALSEAIAEADITADDEDHRRAMLAESVPEWAKMLAHHEFADAMIQACADMAESARETVRIAEREARQWQHRAEGDATFTGLTGSD